MDKRSIRPAGFKESLHSRSTRIGGYSILISLLLVGVLAAGNLLVGALPTSLTRIDMTDNSMYTLSEQTRQVCSLINGDVTLYYIVRSGNEDSTLAYILQRYEELSDRITVVRKDPVVYPTFTQDYTADAVSENSLIAVCGDRSRYLAYDSMYGYDYTDYAVTGEYDYVFQGESLITSALRYVTSEDLPLIYTLTGHNEYPVDEGTLSKALTGDNIETAELNLLAEGSVPEDGDAVLIYSPTQDINADELQALTDYLAGGGRLIFISDIIEDNTPNLSKLIENYGLTSTNSLIIEGDGGMYLNGYPQYILPDITQHESTLPTLNGAYNILLPFARGAVTQENARESLEITPLLTSSDTAYTDPDSNDVSTLEKQEGDITGRFVLAAAVTEDVAEDKQTRLLWYGTSAFLNEDIDSMVGGANTDLFLNGTNWLLEQEEGISIRPKSMTVDTLIMDQTAATAWTVMLCGVLPLSCLAAGVVILIRRKRR